MHPSSSWFNDPPQGSGENGEGTTTTTHSTLFTASSTPWTPWWTSVQVPTS
ncbi:hypothetical protein HMI55_001936 [Coelomomyces lativittatus]|nr:hypothetical protein HMI55_001936 [Coelomomyces lativittatus]